MCSTIGYDSEADSVHAALIQLCVRGLGGIELVISNAGWTAFGAFNELGEALRDHWRVVLLMIRGMIDAVSDDDWVYVSVVSNRGMFSDLTVIDSSCYKRNVMSHMWLMRACQDELTTNQG